MYSPRIYIYKITFEEVPYYYYGVHKEKYFNEEYWGSPVTNKWCWELYTPKKQILQLFDFTDEGWLEAQEVEQRLIKPFYNDDKWCLNECCGPVVSLNISRKVGENSYKHSKGIFALTEEQRKEVCKNAGKKLYEQGKGIFALSSEKRSKISEKAGQKTYKLGKGIHGRTKEQMTLDGKKGGKIGGKKTGRKTYELGIGIHALSKEQKKENGKKGAKKTSSQKWKCLITGHISNPGALSNYQKLRGIDTSNRVRIE